MNPYFSLVAIAFIPVVVSIVLKKILLSDLGKKFSYWPCQISIGLIFGIIAILGTEYGIPIEGAVINARDAAPLCAGLVFGAPAGLIAGFIGGIERWFAVYWGAGYYTRLACSISTCLAGVIAAILRKNMFDDNTPSFDQALIIGVVTEVIHMLMIFVTNLSDVKRAFSFVEACTIPMVLANALSVGLAVLFVNIIDRKENPDKYEKNPPLSIIFQKNQLIVMSVALVLVTTFGYYLQRNISQEDTKELLRLNLTDAVEDVQDRCDESLIYENHLIADIIEKEGYDYLLDLKERFEVSEIDIIDKNGFIIASSDPSNIGFDMRSGSQSVEFMKLLEDNGINEIVQAYMPSAKDPTVYMKYSGVRLSEGFVQTAYNSEQINKEIGYSLKNVAVNRHIGENGSLIIFDNNMNPVTASKGVDLSDQDNIDIEMDRENNTEEYTVYECKINSEKYYYMFTRAESYTILGIIPKAEADFTRSMSTYLNVLLQIIVFGLLHVFVYFIIKFIVVNNFQKVNTSLTRITEGNLNETVDVKMSEEFAYLSSGINMTVDALKKYIEEANMRIDTELKYAKEIQTSVLPRHFPAFPDRNEFDIYALMDPAKEVGGDFYDFYMINSYTLVFAVADVSGKGIPASLFMMRAKSILKTYAENNIGVADIFTNANYNLCEGNEADMFVTAWMGCLNLKTGELKYANAGHNRPLIKRKDGSFEYLNSPAGFILGGMEGIAYKEQHLTLNPGDEIFLYTDGVVEATDVHQELYGDDRLKDCLNKNIGLDSMTICNNVKEDVEKFYEGAPQFDDITELSIQFKKYMEDNEA